MDGWSYKPNTVGEQFRFYKLDLTTRKIQNIHTLKVHVNTAPPIPNIIMQPNPKKNSVLVQIHPSGFYYFDLANNRIEKISVKVEDCPDSFASIIAEPPPGRRTCNVIEIGSGQMNDSPYIAQWSPDGEKVGGLIPTSGFVIFKPE
jgi:hypothetical protein